MKFPAEKAGKRARCPKCDAVVVIPAEEKVEAITADAAAETVPTAPVVSEEDDPGGSYDVFTDPEIEERKKQLAAEEEESRKKKKKKKENLPTVTRKVKAIPDAEAWNTVRLGLLITLVGVLIWGFTHILQSSYVLLGSVTYSEYAGLINNKINEGRQPEDELPGKGQFWKVNDLDIYLGMIAGKELYGTAKVFLVVGTIFYFFQALAWAAGSIVALPVPRRFGTLGLLLTGLILAFFNFIIMFAFKLLPILGVGYVIIPFVAPEIDMTEYNMERLVPLHVIWGAAPFWDSFLTIIFRLFFYLQPLMGCIFLWSVGTAIKDEGVEKSARTLCQLCLGVFFIQVCFHYLAMCGATPVMVMVLRVFYTLWFGFCLLFIGQYAIVILRCRSVLYDKINPKNELLD